MSDDGRSDEKGLRFLSGISARSALTDCPLGAFKVEVERCSGSGDCTSVCLVNVFEAGRDGRCTVVHDELCFGCMACVAQCMDNGVTVFPKAPEERIMVEELLR